MDNEILYFIGAVLIFSLILKFFKKKNFSKTPDSFSDWEEDYKTNDENENFEEDENQKNFDDEYFERSLQGEKNQLFLKFASIQDCNFLQGLLSANGIPSHVEHQHMNSLYGASANLMSSIFAVQLWILTSDYDKALELTTEFIRQKSESLKTKPSLKAMNNIKTVLEILTAPYPLTKSHQILGISVFPKS